MRTLTILGYEYSLDKEKALEDMEGNVGFCDFDHLQMRVANDVPSDVRNSTLIHEIIEAVNYHLEVGLTEQKIKQLEVGLFQALTRNGVVLDGLWLDEFNIMYTGLGGKF